MVYQSEHFTFGALPIKNKVTLSTNKHIIIIERFTTYF